MNVEFAWYCTVDSLMTPVVIVVIDESLDSKEQVRAVFLWLNVNVLVFYRFPKSFYPNVVFCSAATVHAYLHLRALGTCLRPLLACKLAALVRVDDVWSYKLALTDS